MNTAELVKSGIEAKRQITEGKLVIWNTRLESLVASGDVKSAIDLLNAAVDGINNCGCNVQCGAAALSEAVSRPSSGIRG